MRLTLAALVLAVAAGCSACSSESTEGPKPTPEAAAVTLHSEPTPTEPSGTSVPTSEAEVSRPHRLHECPNLSGDRRGLELDVIRVQGIIIGARSNVAMMSDSKGRTQSVRQGEYIGSRCWKIASIGTEWVAMQRESTIDGPTGGTTTVRLYVNDPPRRDLAGK